MSPAVLLLALGLLCVVGLGMLQLVIRRPVLGAALVLIATVFDIAFAQNKPAFFIGGARIHLADLVFVLVVGAAMARLLRTRTITKPQRILIALCVLALLSLLRGVPEFGLQTSVNEFRGYMRFLGAALYMSTFEVRPSLRYGVGKGWMYGSAAVCLIAMLRWGQSLTGVGIGPLWAEYGTVIRSISGTETFFVATGFLVSIVVWRSLSHEMTMRWLSTYLAVMVVLLNRRTVWAAVMAGLGVMLLRDRTLGRRIVSLGIAAVGITAVVLTALPSAGDEELIVEATDTGNLAWRIEGWTDLLESRSGKLLDRAIGEPFGTGFEREVSDRTLESNPHSFYLETLLRLGVIGLLGMLALYATTLRRLLLLRASPDGNFLGYDTLLVVLASQLVWYITWAPGYEQGLIVGLAMSAVAHVQTSARGRQTRVVKRPTISRVDVRATRV